jgi:GNAT superfamily N-acetyltransferase
MTHPALPLRATQIEHAGFVLGRAFLDDPLMTFIFPDDDQRFRELPWFMSVAVRIGTRGGRVHTDDRVAGCAVWLPPGATDVDGIGDAARRWGADALGRFDAAMQHLSDLHHRLMPEAHWYLMLLGVDPPYQGQGVGGELMQPILGEADREGRPAYLETQKARNVPFYRRHGFEVVAETDAPGGGPHLWLMARAPRQRS